MNTEKLRDEIWKAERAAGAVHELLDALREEALEGTPEAVSKDPAKWVNRYYGLVSSAVYASQILAESAYYGLYDLPYHRACLQEK